MGQHTSQPLEGPSDISKPSCATCETASEDNDLIPCAQNKKILYMSGISAAAVSIERLAEFDKCVDIDTFEIIPMGVKETFNNGYDDKENSRSSTSSSGTSYEPTSSILAEARHQFEIGRGLFWSLAVLKLSPHFLHPVDLTASEFLAFVTSEDVDFWILVHRTELLHRMVSRRAEAQRTLQVAGIPYRKLRGIEMFELMDAPGRLSFIAEYQRRQKNILGDLYDVSEAGSVQGGDSPAVVEELRVKTKGPAAEEELGGAIGPYKKKKIPDPGVIVRNTSLPSFKVEDIFRANTLRGHKSKFESLRKLFGKHPRGHTYSGIHAISPCSNEDPSTSSSHMDPSTKTAESRRQSTALRGSVHSIRHLFDGKNRPFKRAGIREHVFDQHVLN